jgi:hypothetical protein
MDEVEELNTQVPSEYLACVRKAGERREDAIRAGFESSCPYYDLRLLQIYV